MTVTQEIPVDKIEEIARAMSAAVNAGKPPIVEWDKLHREERWLYETAARAAYEVMASSDGEVRQIGIDFANRALRIADDLWGRNRAWSRTWGDFSRDLRAALTQSSVQPDRHD